MSRRPGTAERCRRRGMQGQAGSEPVCTAGLASCQGRPFTRQTSHRREGEWLPETQAPDIWFKLFLQPE